MYCCCRWNSDLGGVMLSYTDITLLSSQVRLPAAMPLVLCMPCHAKHSNDTSWPKCSCRQSWLCPLVCRHASIPTFPTSMWTPQQRCTSLRRRQATASVRPFCSVSSRTWRHVCACFTDPRMFPAAGQVNKIGVDYVGLLVVGIFNAAIGHRSIRPDFQHDAQVLPFMKKGPRA